MGARTRFSLLAACLLLALPATAGAASWQPQWLPATDISAPGRLSLAPSVAVASGGDGVVAFLALREGTERVEAAELRAGGHWHEPVDVSPSGCSASHADVAIAVGGDAVAAWGCETAAGSVVEAATKPLRGAWSEPIAISARDIDLGSLDVAAGPGGEAVAAWTRSVAGQPTVELASRSAGVWGAPLSLGAGQGASVGVGAAGAAAVWTSPAGKVEASTRSSFGSWAEPVALAAAAGSDPQPRLGVDEAGRALAVWQRLGTIQASRFAPAAGWSGAEEISRASEGVAAAPALAVSPGGKAAVAWQLADSGGKPIAVHVARGTAAGFGGPGGSSLAAPSARNPAIAIDDVGEAAAVWLRDTGEFAMSVQGATTLAGSGSEWRKPLGVSSEANLSPPAVATDGDGNATVVWAKRYGGGNYKVQSATYQRAAPPVAQLTATEPPSPANDNSPRIQGSVPAGGPVSIFDNSTCSGPAVASGSAEELEAGGIQVQVENNTTTQFYARAGAEGARCFGQVTYSERTGTLGMPEALTRLTTLDPFQTPTGSLTAGPNWGRLLGYEAGPVSSLGWGPLEPYPARAGAYWKRSVFVDSGTGVAVAARLLAAPGTAKSRFFSILLDLDNPSQEGETPAPSGYELRFSVTGPSSPNAYDISIRRWPSGPSLAGLGAFALPLGSYVALVERGGSLSAWADTGLGFSQLLSVPDAAFSEGFAGVEASGNGTRLRRFKAAALPVVTP